MNYTIYIAAAAVMALLIGLVALSISWLQKKVLHNIRSKTMGLLSLYDELLQEKSQALAELDARQTARAEAPAPAAEAAAATDGMDLSAAILNTAQRSGTLSYRDTSAANFYRSIRENFSYELDAVLDVLEEAAPKQTGPATRLLEKLSYDTVFQLSTLVPEDQYSVLESVLEGQEKQLLEAYSGSARRFSSLDFYDRLCSLAALEPGPARLLVAQDVADRYAGRGSIAIEANPQICEGYQFEQNNRLYDFSIKTRELS